MIGALGSPARLRAGFCAMWAPVCIALGLSVSAPVAMAQTASSATPELAPAKVASGGDRKRELAMQVIELQQGPEMERLINDLARSAVGPSLQAGAAQLQRLPKERQAAATEQLNAAARKLGTQAEAEIRNKMKAAVAQSLLPAYTERFSEDELTQLIAFFSSPTIKKYQSVSPELGQALVKRLVELTQPTIKRQVQTFDAEAAKALGLQLAPPKASASASATKKP